MPGVLQLRTFIQKPCWVLGPQDSRFGQEREKVRWGCKLSLLWEAREPCVEMVRHWSCLDEGQLPQKSRLDPQ